MSILLTRILERLISLLLVWLASKGLDLSDVFANDGVAQVAAFVLASAPPLVYSVWQHVRGMRVHKTMDANRVSKTEAQSIIKSGHGEPAL